MTAAAIYVAYGVDALDLSWIDESADVIVVHNDDRLPEEAAVHAGVRHLYPGENLGFGAAVNLAVSELTSDRVVLCNPDTSLQREHWVALVDASRDEIVTLALTDESGLPNSVVNGYWSVPAFIGTAFRLGRLMPRSGRLRAVAARLLGSWGRAHAESLSAAPGGWSLSERWASGAVLSLPVEPLRSVGGFDEGYFLYYEDVDLQQRLAAAYPSLVLRLASVPPGLHAVGGTIDEAERRTVARLRRASAARYAHRQPGMSWSVAARVIGWSVR